MRMSVSIEQGMSISLVMRPRRFASAWATARLALDICLRSKLGLTWAKGTSFTPIVEFINSLGP